MMSTPVKLTDGYYKTDGHFTMIVLKVSGEKLTGLDGAGRSHEVKVQYGDFGETNCEVREICSGQRYEAKLTIQFTAGEESLEFVDLIVLTGTSGFVSFGGCGVSSFAKITNQEFVELDQDFDSIEAPACPYKIQPENQGKLIWLTGAPGLGKSTSAQMLGRDQGFVYYEADCFLHLKNPYVPLTTENPTLAQIRQKILKGEGKKERCRVANNFVEQFWRLMKGSQDEEKLRSSERDYMLSLCSDVRAEKDRLGGDWAVASVIRTREERDIMRATLGPELILVCLEMSNQERRQRIISRHGGESEVTELVDVVERSSEPICEDEENVIVIQVLSTMSKQDVVEEILRRIQ